MHTAYLKVIDGRAHFAGTGDFRAFLFGVIRRTAREERRRTAIRATLTLAMLRREPESSVPPSGLGPIMRDERSRELIAALDRLSPRQRDVLHLVFYQDFTIAAAADVLGVSVGSARVHYERGKAQLRRILGDDGNGTA